MLSIHLNAFVMPFKIKVQTDKSGGTSSTDYFIMAHIGDSDFFSINSVSGALSFKNPLEYKNPQDKNGDNIYRVQVKVHCNSIHEDIQTIRVEVSNVAALVPITSYLPD